MKNFDVKFRRKCNLGPFGSLCIFLAAIFLTSPLPVPAQERNLEGIVKTAAGDPVVGATIIVTGTQTGTSSDLSGNFSLNLKQPLPANATLTVSYIGYKTQTVTPGAKTFLEITLEEESALLDDVVVVGYGTARKKDLTGSLSSVNSQQIIARQQPTISSALQGAMPGVTITRTHSAPGEEATIRVRGITSMTDGNTESILEYNYLVGGPNHSWDQLFMPGGDNTTMGGRATPTQEMVESYELATGGYPDWTPWHNTTTGTTDTPPYEQLEPRFHASVLYNGCAWKGRTLEPYVNGKDGYAVYDDGSALNGRSTTGYYLRKMLDENYTDYSKACTQPWIAIRLAEVILNHAEACYRLNDNGSANNDVRRIRSRVGLPYTNKSGEELMAAIRQERKIELYCEGHLYWDMRRWQLAHTAYTGLRVHGLKIEKQGATFIYTYVDCDRQDRLFEKKLYCIPLPETELSNNSAVKQFPEWL